MASSARIVSTVHLVKGSIVDVRSCPGRLTASWCHAEYPFRNAPGLGSSTGAYLLGLMPPELLQVCRSSLLVSISMRVVMPMGGPETRRHHVQVLGISLPLLRRDPHYFLVWPALAAAASVSTTSQLPDARSAPLDACVQPTTGERYLLFGSDREATRSQLIKFFSLQDWRADCRMQVRLAFCAACCQNMHLVNDHMQSLKSL